MPYHHTPNTTQSESPTQSKVNAQGNIAPPGYHYMPDGTLMSDAEHATLYGSSPLGSLNTTHYHLWSGSTCGGYSHGVNGILYFSGANALFGGIDEQAGGTVIGNSPGGFATTECSEAFYQFMGAPAVGTIVGFDSVQNIAGLPPLAHHCQEYLGTTVNGNHNLFYDPAHALGNITHHPSCQACDNTPLVGFESWDCVQIGDHPKFGKECTSNQFPQGSSFGGQYATHQECLESGCEGISSDKDIKVISSFQLSTIDLKAAGETRQFSVAGENGATFDLEVLNEDDHYYNFQLQAFQATKTKLSGKIANGVYTNSVKFPTVTDDDYYKFNLSATGSTKHVERYEVRFADDTIDINSSTGSNSLLLEKIIYQYTDTSLILSAMSPSSASAMAGLAVTTQTITTQRNKRVENTAFEISVTSGSTKAFKIDIAAPTPSDLFVSTTRTIGASPVSIDGENIYPTATPAFTGDDINGAITSGSVVRMDNTDLSAVIGVGDKITTPVMTDTVNGAVNNARAVTMDSAIATKMAVGDRVTGNAQLDAAEFTVSSLDTTNQFTLSSAATIADGITLSFSSKINRSLTTVTVVETSGVATDFTMSQAIQFRDNASLTFFPQSNYMWPLDNINGLSTGMTVTADNIIAGSKISDYTDKTTVFTGEVNEYEIINKEVPALDTLAAKPTITNGVITTQTGNVIFDKQQKLLLAGDSIKFFAHNYTNIYTLSGYEVKLSDLAVALTKPTTTTTSVVTNSTSVPVASGDGIMDDVSTVSGIGINPKVADPTVTNIASYSGTTATLTLSAAQTLESGITLTFDGAGETIVISGNIEIIRAGTASETLYFDLDKLLTATSEAS